MQISLLADRRPHRFRVYPDEYRFFVRGYDPAARKTPAHIAWILENEAVEREWLSGYLVGSERDLIQRFRSSRDVVREAIRVLESRGSMVMERGRNGGLRLTEPSVERAADGFATFLRATGFDEARAKRTAEIANPVLAAFPGTHVVVQLYRRTLELLVPSASTTAQDIKARGFRIARQLILRHAPIPVLGVAIGSESALVERFSSSRSILRQALRILDDLGMLEVQRGRGGGYRVIPPSNIGMVRNLFALFAARQPGLNEVLRIKWALDRIKLHLAIRALCDLNSEEREHRLDSLAIDMSQMQEPERWCLLQHALGRAARNPLINTLLWGLVAYDVRMGSRSVSWGKISASLRAEEFAIVAAMREQRDGDADDHLSCAQTLISGLLA